MLKLRSDLNKTFSNSGLKATSSLISKPLSSTGLKLESAQLTGKEVNLGLTVARGLEDANQARQLEL